MSTPARSDTERSNAWMSEEDEWQTATPSGIYRRALPELGELGRVLDGMRRWAASDPAESWLDPTSFEPRHERRLSNLEGERQKLLAWGEQLYQRGRSWDRNALRPEIERFTTALAAHEDARTDLLQDDLLIDIGTVD